jgi:hypothetical protein
MSRRTALGRNCRWLWQVWQRHYKPLLARNSSVRAAWALK